MQLTYDRSSNSIRLVPSANQDATTSRAVTTNATLDIGPSGRLIGIEFRATESELALWLQPVTATYVTHDNDGLAYIQITPGPIDEARSTNLSIITEYANNGAITAIVVPRRGTGYEISYPSGNQ